MGFKVLMVNQRAHGDSEGNFTTFGQYEKLDLKKWILFALRNYGSTDSILLHGASMGAATVLMASKLELPDNIKLIVADSSYTNLRALYFAVAKPKITRIFYPGIDFFVWKKHHFLMGEVSPKKAVSDGRIPIFLWHGKADEMVPYEMAGELLESSKSPFKELYSVENALHTQSYVIDRPGVEKRLSEIVAMLFPTYKNVKAKKEKTSQNKSA